MEEHGVGTEACKSRRRQTGAQSSNSGREEGGRGKNGQVAGRPGPLPRGLELWSRTGLWKQVTRKRNTTEAGQVTHHLKEGSRACVAFSTWQFP